MAIRNATYDLTAEELAAVKAADAAGHASALAGVAAATSEELNALPAMLRALRGRGHTHVMSDLLNMYYSASSARAWFNGAAATALGVTDDRGIEGT